MVESSNARSDFEIIYLSPRWSTFFSSIFRHYSVVDEIQVQLLNYLQEVARLQFVYSTLKLGWHYEVSGFQRFTIQTLCNSQHFPLQRP